MGLPPWASLASSSAQDSDPSTRPIKPLPASSYSFPTAHLTPSILLQADGSPRTGPHAPLEFDQHQHTNSLPPAPVKAQPVLAIEEPLAAAPEPLPSTGEGVFGFAGRMIARSLREASSFSTAGLFGALPQISPQPVRPALSRQVSRASSCASYGAAGEADGGCSDPMHGCTHEHEPVSHEAAITAGSPEGEWPQGRCNKKKRKVPVTNSAGFSHYLDDSRANSENGEPISGEPIFPRRSLQGEPPLARATSYGSPRRECPLSE